MACFAGVPDFTSNIICTKAPDFSYEGPYIKMLPHTKPFSFGFFLHVLRSWTAGTMPWQLDREGAVAHAQEEVDETPEIQVRRTGNPVKNPETDPEHRKQEVLGNAEL